MYKLVGKEVIDYISKKTGNRVSGAKIYLNYESSRVEGFKTVDVYVSEETYKRFFASVPLGSILYICFDLYGHALECSVIS